MMKLRNSIILVVLGLLPLASCTESMVTSVPIDHTPQHQQGVPYGEYGVADSIIKITLADGSASSTGGSTPQTSATTPPTGSKPAAAAPAAADASTPGAANATPTSDTQSPADAVEAIQITDAPAAAAPAATPIAKKAKVAKKATTPGTSTPAPSWCDSTLKTYTAARTSTVQSVVLEQTLLDGLDHLVANLPSKDKLDNHSAGQADELVDDYLTKQKDPAIQKALASGIQYGPLVTAYRTLCPLKIVATIVEETEPSTEHGYRLYFDHSVLANDTFTAGQSNGFLTSVVASADDQTGNVIVDAVKSLASVAFAVSPGTALKAAGAGHEYFHAGGQFLFSLAMVKQFRKGLDNKDPAQALTQLKDLKNLLEKYINAVSLPALTPILPAEYDISMSALDNPNVGLKDLNDSLARFDVAVTARCNKQAVLKPSQTDNSTPVDGIVVSESRPCFIEIDRTDADDRGVTLKRAGFWAQDARSVYSLPVDRSYFVLNKTSYAFNAGRLTNVDISRPSQAVGVATLPYNIVGAFFSAISDGVKGQSGVIDAETDRIKSKTALIEQQAAIRQAQTPAPATTP